MSHAIRLAGVVLGVLVLGMPARRAAGDETLKEKVDQAIKNGVAYLKQARSEKGTWDFPSQEAPADIPMGGAPVGSTSLVGLTLLECGVPADDPIIQKAAAAVRPGTVGLTYTYAVSLAIMFLDRLGDPGDVALIESLTVRLLAGQCRDGGWSYQCPAIGEAEMRRLRAHIKERNELVAEGKLPKTAPHKRRTEADLPREIVAQLVQLSRQGRFAPLAGDNSNTQFAALALWIARRQGLPVSQALSRLESSMRWGQHANGGWTYTRPLDQRMRGMPTPMGRMGMVDAAMTCSGLLGLAVGSGTVNEKVRARDPKTKKGIRDPNKDPAVRRGLAVLAACIGEPVGDDDARQPMRDRQSIGKGYYFLWSLERVAMIYKLDKIGKKDWYTWGAEILLKNQNGDGSWNGKYGAGGVDTSFALLFLRRSNLARDLTSSLKGTSGELGLSSGGEGGSSLIRGKDFSGGIDPKAKPEKQETRRPAEKRRVIQAENEREKAIARLSTELVQAPRRRQEELIGEFKQKKGLVYTEALAGSIPLLQGDIKGRARAALVDRFLRMKSDTLKDKLVDDNLEVRRAAALACARKKVKALVPDLITLLGDPELPVAIAARQALKELSGQDFGPDDDATRAERKTAIAKWKAWWKKQGNG